MLNFSKYKTALLLITFFFTLSGCGGGSGEDLDQNGDPIDNTKDPIPLADNLASIQANIFSLNCALSGCHSGSSPPEGLLLTETASFANLVNVDSSEVPSLKRVNPGNAEDSYLIHKVEGRASVGVQMPRNLPPLSADKIQVLRSWIDKGALGPTLTSIQQNVFTPICTQCHTGQNPPANLNLEQDESFNNLVGIKRTVGDEFRVIAGNADNSFLIDKLEGNNLGGDRGERMPLSGPFLDQDIINVIRDWITDGAKNN